MKNTFYQDIINITMKKFDFPPYRPPSEAQSALIRVSRGCPWNHCTFCGMYKNTTFELRPFEEIAADVGLLPEIFTGCRTVFIADSDSLIHPDIIRVVKLISATLPDNRRITSYARAHTLKRCGSDKLHSLKEAGLNRVHVGLESGDRKVLKRIRKGVTPEIMIQAGRTARQAGLELCFYALCGIGGDTRWREHADGTADLINQVNPDFVRFRTLTVIPGAPLHEEWKAGEFVPIQPINRLEETRRLIEGLQVEGCSLISDHITNQLWGPEGIVYGGVEGILTRDKQKMLDLLTRAIEGIRGRDDIMDTHTLVQRGYIDGRL